MLHCHDFGISQSLYLTVVPGWSQTNCRPTLVQGPTSHRLRLSLLFLMVHHHPSTCKDQPLLLPTPFCFLIFMPHSHILLNISTTFPSPLL